MIQFNREQREDCVKTSVRLGLHQQFPVTTSIDTLRLLCDIRALAPDFASYASHYEVTTTGTERPEVILWREGGKPVRGQSAVAKSGCFTFYLARINPRKPPQLTITFSFPRCRWGHNARAVTQDDVANVIEEIQERAADVGLQVEASRAQITELHLFRDVGVKRGFDDYLEILRAIEPPYGTFFKEDTGWILRGSRPNRWAIYDKRAELRERSQNRDEEKSCIAGILGLAVCQERLKQEGRAALMRFEWRLQGARKIRSQMGFDDFGSLARADTLLDEQFDQALARDVFRWPLADEAVVQSWRECQALRDQAPTRADGLLLGPLKLAKVLAFEGWKQWVTEFGLEGAHEILKRGSSASDRGRFKASLWQIQHSLRMPCGLFWGELYAELARAVFFSAHLEKLPRLIPVTELASEPEAEQRKQQA